MKRLEVIKIISENLSNSILRSKKRGGGGGGGSKEERDREKKKNNSCRLMCENIYMSRKKRAESGEERLKNKQSGLA